MARFVQARLVPIHEDPLDEQKNTYPALAQLSAAQYDALRQKFFHTDDMSYFGYVKAMRQGKI